MKRLLSAFALICLLCGASAQTSSTAADASPSNIDLSSVAPSLRKHLIEPPHVTCVSQDYNGPLETARYINQCSEPLHITIVFGNIDDPRQLDLAPGKSRNNSFTKMDYIARQGSSWYICPKGYSAVDTKGQYFKRPISIYLCREIAS